MTEQTAPLSFRIARTTGTLEADVPEFFDYARQHLAPIVQPISGQAPQAPEAAVSQARIRGRLRWHDRPPLPRAQWLAGIDAMERPDRDLYVDRERLAWLRIDDFRDLLLQARWDGEVLEIVGDYHFFLNRSRWRDRLRRLWERRGLAHKREKRFATLLYYLVYYPTLWWHEVCEGAHPLHAAGVVAERGALVLVGPSGVGKSTLTVALTAAGGKPLSETFLMHRGTHVAAVPEPVLLDAWSRRWLGDAAAPLAPAPGRFVFDRQGFHLSDPITEAPAVALVLPQRGGRAGITRLDAAEAQRRISGGHQLIKDMRRYWAFAAALEKLAPGATEAGLMAAREAALGVLTREIPSWELRLTPEVDRQAVTDLLAEIAARSGGGGLTYRGASR